MSAKSQTAVGHLKQTKKFLLEKKELLQSIFKLSDATYIKCQSQEFSEEASEDYLKMIEIRDPLLKKLESLSDDIQDQLTLYNSEPWDSGHSSHLEKIRLEQSNCQQISGAILDLDKKILEELENYYSQTKKDLEQIRNGKKVINAYGRNVGQDGC